MNEFCTLYLCDPTKAKTCTKEGCYQNNGPCRMTTNREYACVKGGEVVTVMTGAQQERVVRNNLNLSDQTDIALKLAIARYNNVPLDIPFRPC